jgi:hypothetical protein
LDGEHVACLINFISPPTYSQLATAATTAEREKKEIYRMMVSAKKKEKNRTEQNRREYLVMLG